MDKDGTIERLRQLIKQQGKPLNILAKRRTTLTVTCSCGKTHDVRLWKDEQGKTTRIRFDGAVPKHERVE